MLLHVALSTKIRNCDMLSFIWLFVYFNINIVFNRKLILRRELKTQLSYSDDKVTCNVKLLTITVLFYIPYFYLT